MELFNGNCLDILKTIPNDTVDLIVTDPPYNIRKNTGKMGTGNGGTVNNIMKFDVSLVDLETVYPGSEYDIQKYNEEFIRVMKDINIYIWCNKAQIVEYLDFYVTKHKCKFDIISWHKTNALPTYANKYLSDTEYLLYFHKGKGKCFPSCYEDAKTFYLAPINHKGKKMYGHPTVKPLDITERVIRNSSKEGMLILGPFMGSGTTGVACKHLNREFIGIEIDEKYFEVAKKRIEEE